MRLPARSYRTVGSLLETMEQKSSAVHVLLAKIVTELTKRKWHSWTRSVLQTTLRFETPL